MKTLFRIVGAAWLTLCFIGAIFFLFFLMHEYKTLGNVLGITASVIAVTGIFLMMYFGPMGDKKP